MFVPKYMPINFSDYDRYNLNAILTGAADNGAAIAGWGTDRPAAPVAPGVEYGPQLPWVAMAESPIPYTPVWANEPKMLHNSAEPKNSAPVVITGTPAGDYPLTAGLAAMALSKYRFPQEETNANKVAKTGAPEKTVSPATAQNITYSNQRAPAPQRTALPMEIYPLIHNNGTVPQDVGTVFSNGNRAQYTTNDFEGNGGDPTASSWIGANMNPNAAMSVALYNASVEDAARAQRNAAAAQQAANQNAINAAMNDPATYAAMVGAMRQGATPQEALYGALGTGLINNGQYGAFLPAVFPEYAKAAQERMDTTAAMGLMGGYDVPGQSAAFGVQPNIGPVTYSDDGSTVTAQYGNARFTYDVKQLRDFARMLSQTPNAPALLKAMEQSNSIQDRAMLEILKHELRMKQDDNRSENRVGEYEAKEKIKNPQANLSSVGG
jgi:hypothetical protein